MGILPETLDINDVWNKYMLTKVQGVNTGSGKDFTGPFFFFGLLKLYLSTLYNFIPNFMQTFPLHQFPISRFSLKFSTIFPQMFKLSHQILCSSVTPPYLCLLLPNF
jgi:hypothetical protein